MSTTFHITKYQDVPNSPWIFNITEMDGEKFVQSWGPYFSANEVVQARAYLEEQAKRNPLLWPNPRKS